MQVIVTVNLPIAFVPNDEGTTRTCCRKTILSDEVLYYQMHRSIDDRPDWVLDPKVWKKMTPEHKLKAFIETFNLGWGVSYEIVEE